MKLLDLFCGAGGAAMGYYLAGYTDIVGVDIVKQPNYPFRFVQADALTISLDGYDLIHASPPCQAFISKGRAARSGQVYQNLIPTIRDRLKGLVYVIENIIPAPLENPTTLCGQTFGLGVYRHRKFETSFPLRVPLHLRHQEKVKRLRGDSGTLYAVYGHEVGTLAEWSKAMDIDWMKTKHELANAIPPAYTNYIAQQFLGVVVEPQ